MRRSQRVAERSATEQRILDAAVQLFAKQGFNATTTREIARLADVNEATLFRRFSSKDDLVWAAIESRLQRVHPGRKLQAALEDHARPEAVIPMIVRFLVRTSVLHPEITRLLHFSFMEMRADAERVYKRQLAPIFSSIVGYLTRCIEQGTIKSVDPMTTVAGVLAMVIAHQYLVEAFTGRAPLEDMDEAVATYSRFWIDSLTRTAASAKPASGDKASHAGDRQQV